MVDEYLLNGLKHKYELLKIRVFEISEKPKIKKTKRTTKQIHAELERLNLMFQKNRITVDYYDAEYARLDQELNEQTGVEKIVRKDYSYLENVLENGLDSMYSSLNMENRQAFWRRIIDQIHISGEGKMKYVDFL